MSTAPRRQYAYGLHSFAELKYIALHTYLSESLIFQTVCLKVCPRCENLSSVYIYRGSLRSPFSKRDPEINLLLGALNFLYITSDTSHRSVKLLCTFASAKQGCLMVYYFPNINPNLGNFGRVLEWKTLVYPLFGHLE
jgi:hypothetical protein